MADSKMEQQVWGHGPGGLPLNQSTAKIPPGWSEATSYKYTFRRFLIEFQVWMTRTELTHHQIGPALVSRLDGAPRRIGELMAAQPSGLAEDRWSNLLTHGQQGFETNLGRHIVKHGWELYLDELKKHFDMFAQEKQIAYLKDFSHSGCNPVRPETLQSRDMSSPGHRH